jgi:hypothetical protein
MNIVLADEEVRALKQALDAYLPTLNFELSRVKLDRPDLRHDLVGLEATLRKLRERLSESTVVESGELFP